MTGDQIGLIRLKYGNTNTFLVQGRLLVDTDYAGTLQTFYKALRASGVRLESITHVVATHYHPDHCGLIGELQQHGIKLILMESQKQCVHDADYIFDRDRLKHTPIDAGNAEVIRFEESRAYLKTLGIAGEIIPTASHSPDSVSVILDNGDCIVGDLQPMEYIGGYADNRALRTDWSRILSCQPKRILYAHLPEKRMEP